MSDKEYTWFKDDKGIGFGFSNTDEDGGFVGVKRLPPELIAEEAKELALKYLRDQLQQYERIAEAATRKARAIQGAMTRAGDPESLDAFLKSLTEGD